MRNINDARLRIHLGRQDCLELDNLADRRDRGYANGWAEGMWRVMAEADLRRLPGEVFF